MLDIKLITDKTTRRSKGMAYIEYATQEDVFMAMQLLPGQLLLGQPVQVRTASGLNQSLASFMHQVTTHITHAHVEPHAWTARFVSLCSCSLDAA